MESLFTHKDYIEGNVGIGKLPDELHSIIDGISKEYNDIIPDKDAPTYHTWYKEMPPSIKPKVEQIQKNAFWNNLCEGNKKCKIINVTEMDELYYSNFSRTADNTSLQNFYGSTGNIVVHKDCHSICSFDNAKLYRIIIGLSDNNDNVTTKFTKIDVGKKINKNDYIAFDFSRTTHQVVKENQEKKTPRTLLKLHFLLYEDNKYSKTYINFIKDWFIYYDIITRYLLKTGTDPETFYQFFIGLGCQFFYRPNIDNIILVLLLLMVISITLLLKLKLVYKNILKIIGYTFSSLMGVYLLIVTAFWLRYKLFGIR
jgi:hypothetical protein